MNREDTRSQSVVHGSESLVRRITANSQIFSDFELSGRLYKELIDDIFKPFQSFNSERVFYCGLCGLGEGKRRV